jgi:AMMECR1 domain-containing protein
MYVKLAKAAAEYFINKQEVLPLPSPVPSTLLAQRACYVSVFEKPGSWLRSAYGEPLPRYKSLAEEIIMNTVRAVDGRVRRVDMPYLEFQVAVLGQLQRISDTKHLNPAVYGLYVRSERQKTAIILPNRVGIETADDQVGTALREAGITDKYESVTLYRFTVTYYE